jgi:hypothetical protein
VSSLRVFAGLASLVAVLLVADPGPATAAAVIDTGAIPCSPTECGGWTLDSTQWLAGRFSVAQPTHVTSLEAYVSLYVQPLTLTVYGNVSGGALPDTALVFFSMKTTPFDDPNQTPSGPSRAQWQGLRNLDLLLQPGTYWLSLEVRPGDGYNGYAPTSDNNAGPIQPAQAYAAATSSFWHTLTPGFAFRIYALPEPASSLLTGLALSLLAARSRSCSRRGR